MAPFVDSPPSPSHQDYIHMKPKYFQKLMEVALDRVVANYIRRLLSRTITFTKYEERLEVGEKICKDSERIKVGVQQDTMQLIV